MSSDCLHRWTGDPAWGYSICVLCFDVTDPVLVPELAEDPSDPAGPRRRRDWIRLSTNDPVFMGFMQQDAPCPLEGCLGHVAEEPTRRRDGSIATGFTCRVCGARWWAEESLAPARDLA